MKIAVIGCTGAVGREILVELSDITDPKFEVLAFASQKSAGIKIPFRESYLTVSAFKLESLKGCDFALMSAGGDFSREWSERIAKQGTIVIDNSSAWRMDKDVPLVVPEVNAHELSHIPKGIIANPNCSTIQMVVSLKPLSDKFGLDQVIVSTYQSVSGSGQRGIDELSEQVNAQFHMRDPILKIYPQTIAFNVIPVVGTVFDSGYCQEEEKIILETRKIMGLLNLTILPMVARIPVFTCHSESITVKLKKEVHYKDLVEALSDVPGLIWEKSNDPKDFPTPHTVAQKNEVFISRVRLPYEKEKSHWISFWNVSDNLKKGAATNAVQIFEKVYRLKNGG